MGNTCCIANHDAVVKQSPSPHSNVAGGRTEAEQRRAERLMRIIEHNQAMENGLQDAEADLSNVKPSSETEAPSKGSCTSTRVKSNSEYEADKCAKKEKAATLPANNAEVEIEDVTKTGGSRVTTDGNASNSKCTAISIITDTVITVMCNRCCRKSVTSGLPPACPAELGTTYFHLRNTERFHQMYRFLGWLDSIPDTELFPSASFSATSMHYDNASGRGSVLESNTESGWDGEREIEVDADADVEVQDKQVDDQQAEAEVPEQEPEQYVRHHPNEAAIANTIEQSFEPATREPQEASGASTVAFVGNIQVHEGGDSGDSNIVAPEHIHSELFGSRQNDSRANSNELEDSSLIVQQSIHSVRDAEIEWIGEMERQQIEATARRQQKKLLMLEKQREVQRIESDADIGNSNSRVQSGVSIESSISGNYFIEDGYYYCEKRGWWPIDDNDMGAFGRHASNGLTKHSSENQIGATRVTATGASNASNNSLDGIAVSAEYLLATDNRFCVGQLHRAGRMIVMNVLHIPDDASPSEPRRQQRRGTIESELPVTNTSSKDGENTTFDGVVPTETTADPKKNSLSLNGGFGDVAREEWSLKHLLLQLSRRTIFS